MVVPQILLPSKQDMFAEPKLGKPFFLRDPFVPEPIQCIQVEAGRK